jgi:hypothetical protein
MSMTADAGWGHGVSPLAAVPNHRILEKKNYDSSLRKQTIENRWPVEMTDEAGSSG